MKSYYVYILGNGKGALYVGMTSEPIKRLHEHKTKAASSFTSKYDIDQLLFIEEFSDVYQAMDQEKRIKGWTRKKKLELIRTQNPRFEDQSRDWFE